MTDPYRTNAERQAQRNRNLEEGTIRGIRFGLRAGRSMRCAEGDHGCRNTGEQCLCICHDAKESS